MATTDGATSDLRFVDAHVHFWDHEIEGIHWPYLDPGFDHPRLRGMHRLDAPRFTDYEFVEQTGPFVPRRIVHVQSCTEDRPGLESTWVQSIADERGLVGAIIAKARVAEPDLAHVIAANSCRLLRGFRDMSSPQSIGTSEFTAGFDLIAASGWSLEVLVPYPKFVDVCALADRHPATTVVLGHAGQPEHRDAEYFAAWSSALEQFRHRPNVVVKISALASGADPDWSVESIRPWVETCLDVFGSHRAMFATNWPIDRLYGSYAQLLEAYVSIASTLATPDRSNVFADTATRVYDIGEAAPPDTELATRKVEHS
ncbi:MAG TPA: amidohydrolase family protein [Ilumatobacteraceae bacterium]